MKRVAIITSVIQGTEEKEDLSGKVIREIVEANGYQVVHMEILPDEPQMLSDAMMKIADQNTAELILHDGGDRVFTQRLHAGGY